MKMYHKVYLNFYEKFQNSHHKPDYELVDAKPNNFKRNATITYKLTSFDTQWTPNTTLNDLKPQPGTSMTNLENNNDHAHPLKNHNFKSTRGHQKSLSTRISSLKRESKTTQTLSIVVSYKTE